jgi:gas vesicle protein
LNSDEECLAQAIADTNAGLAATNVEDVKDFVMEKYQEWKTNGYTHQKVVNKEQFTRQRQAEQFEQLFIECIR